jgi:hypothetical protein
VYSGLSVANDFCAYHISTFPSQEMLENEESTTGILFGIALLVVFLSSACVFCGYDNLVAVRQQKVMTTGKFPTIGPLCDRSLVTLSSNLVDINPFFLAQSAKEHRYRILLVSIQHSRSASRRE